MNDDATAPRDFSVTALMVVALALRLLLPAAAIARTGDLGSLETGDSREYLGLATALVEKGEYVDAAGPHLFRPPGYPLQLALGVLIGRPFLTAIVVQALLGSLTVYLIYLTARLLLRDRRAAVFAGIASCVEPVMLHWNAKLMAEGMLTTFVTLFAYALLRYLTRSLPLRWLIVAALAASGAAYAKPIAYFLPAWTTAILLACAARAPDRGRRVRDAALFLGVCAAALGLWQVRNGLVSGYFGFSSQMDRIISLPAPAAVVAAREGRSFSEVRDEFKTKYEKPGFETSEFYAAARRRGFEALWSAPGTYAWIHIKGMLQTLFNPGAIPYLVMLQLHSELEGTGRVVKDQGSIAALLQARRREPLVFWVTLVLGLVLLPYLLLPAIALLRSDAPDRTARLVLAAVALYFLALSGGAWGQSRFRHPMMPSLCVLAACALAPNRSGAGTRFAKPSPGEA